MVEQENSPRLGGEHETVSQPTEGSTPKGNKGVVDTLAPPSISIVLPCMLTYGMVIISQEFM